MCSPTATSTASRRRGIASKGFLMLLHFFWMYLIMARMVFIIAIMRLPKAAVPQWYQAPCRNDQMTVLLPIFPLSLVKYHVDTARAKIIWPRAIINSDDQKYTNIMYQPALKVVASYTICRAPFTVSISPLDARKRQ